MEINISTPALLFPAISLLMLAYTNKFLSLATLIRNLHGQYKQDKDPVIFEQISNLRIRLALIKYMQALAVASILMCVIAMIFILLEHKTTSIYLFFTSLVLLMASLVLTLQEIRLSNNALNLHLKNIEKM